MKAIKIDYPVKEGQVICDKQGRPRGVLIAEIDDGKLSYCIGHGGAIITRFIRPEEDLNNIGGKPAYYDEKGRLCTNPISPQIGTFVSIEPFTKDYIGVKINKL